MLSTKIEYLVFEDIAKKLESLQTDTLLLVADKKVYELWWQGKINLTGKIVHTYLLDNAENAKCYEEFEKCCDFFLSKGIHRKAHLIAFGGGATSDFAGFVASTLLRGISWSVIPTTLLAMVDASIGGKTAINSKYGKNLVGTFYLPENLWVNERFLETLPEHDLQSGKGEILKYAFLSKNIFDLIERRAPLSDVIHECALYKQKIVEEDFKETHIRQVLNLGHTFGHVFEKGMKISHGHAVVMGIEFILKHFNEQNDKFLNSFYRLMEKLGLKIENTQEQIDDELFFKLLESDKKKISDKNLNLILIEEIGHPVIRSFSISSIKECVRRINKNG